jgi:AraC-like DNA-binding protein
MAGVRADAPERWAVGSGSPSRARLPGEKVPLEHFRTFRSRNAEEVRAFLRSQQFSVEIPFRETHHVDARVNGVHLSTEASARAGQATPAIATSAPALFRVPGSPSGVYLGFLEYGCAIELGGLPARDDYRILLPIRRSIEAVVGDDTVSCREASGAIITTPSRTKLVRLERGTALLNLFLKGPELTRQLGALLGDTIRKPIEFAPTIDVARSYGRSLWNYASTAISDVERLGSLLQNRLAASLFEQFIILGLLQSHPHNYSVALRRGGRSVAPRSVRRAVDYMQANLDAPITISDLAAVSGAAGQTLWRHFREFSGTTPMRYLRDARLDRVREALREAEPEESVARIAMKWGFGHMGRFAGQYRKRFGENPSETLKRHR